MSAGSQHEIEGGIETKDDFRKLIALLVEFVKTVRLERAVKYDIKCEERQREKWNHQLDLARLELYWVQRGLRAGVDTDPEEVLEAEIEKFERKLDLSLAKIGESKAETGSDIPQVKRNALIDDLVSEFNEAADDLETRHEIVRRLPNTYHEALAEFLTAHPNRSRKDLDRQDLRYNILAAYQQAEAEGKAKKLRYLLMRTRADIDLPYAYDFPMDESDEKNKEPRAAAQLEEKAMKFPEALPKVEEWMERLPDPWYPFGEDGIAGLEQPRIHRWKADPIAFQDIDRYSVLQWTSRGTSLSSVSF